MCRLLLGIGNRAASCRGDGDEACVSVLVKRLVVWIVQHCSGCCNSSTSLPLVILVALAIGFTDEHRFYPCPGIIAAAVVTNIEPQGTRWGLNEEPCSQPISTTESDDGICGLGAPEKPVSGGKSLPGVAADSAQGMYFMMDTARCWDAHWVGNRGERLTSLAGWTCPLPGTFLGNEKEECVTDPCWLCITDIGVESFDAER